MDRPEFPFARPLAGSATDAELGDALRACARQSVAGLRRLHDLMAPRLLAELLQMLGDRRVAEAALVDCFATIWNEAPNFNARRTGPRTWLLSLARHQAIGLLRRADSPLPDDEVDGELRFLHAALQDEGIAEDQQLLHLIWRSGRSPQEVARALQMPLRRVKQGMRSSIDAMIASHEA